MQLLLKRVVDHWYYLAIFLFVGLVNYWIFNDRIDLINLALVGSLALVIAGILIFKKEYFLYLAIACVPLSIKYGVLGAGTVISMPGELLVAILLPFLFWKAMSKGFINKRILTHPLTIIIGIDILWLIITSITSSLPEVSFKRTVVRISFVAVYYFLFAHWFLKQKNIPKLFLLYGIGLIYVMFEVFNNHSNYDFIVQASYLVTQPFYADHTVYGASLAFILPFFVILFFKARDFELSFAVKWLVGLFTVTLFLALFLTFSRAAVLSLIVSFLFYFLLRFKVGIRGFLLLLTIIGIIGALSYETLYQKVRENEAVSNQGDYAQHVQSVTNISTDNSNLERINRWICAIRMFKERPITGFAPGTYQFEYGKYQSLYEMTYLSTYHGDKGNAHSEFLTYLSESGLPGIISFTLMLLITIATGFRVVYLSADAKSKYLGIAALLGLVGYFFHGFFNSFMDQDKIAILVFGSMAMLVALDVRNKDVKST